MCWQRVFDKAFIVDKGIIPGVRKCEFQVLMRIGFLRMFDEKKWAKSKFKIKKIEAEFDARKK